MENLNPHAKILIIDDQQANVDVLEQLLEIKGYLNFKSILHSVEAIEVILAYQPDLILLDLMMPKVSGFDILDMLQSKRRVNNLMPIIVLTADSTSESKMRALTLGASDFLTKPFDIAEVGLRIDNQLSKVYLLKELQNQKAALEITVSERTNELQTLYNELEVAYEELAYQKTIYQVVADNTYNWEFWDDVNGVSKYQSPSCLRISGYAANEFLQNPQLIHEIIHPEDKSLFEYHRHEARNHPAPIQIHFRILTKTGEIVHIEHICRPVYDSTGIFIGTRGTNVDITERVTNERRLIESEKRFREIFETLPVISVQGYNRNREVIYWNNASEILYGYNSSESVGKKLDDLFHFSTDGVVDNIINAFEFNLPIPSQELLLTGKNGLPITVYSNKFILENLLGEKELYCVDIDLSELKEKERRLMLSEERYRSIINVSNTGAWEYDMANDHLWISDEFLTMLGFTVIDDNFDELKSSGYNLWLKLLHPEDYEQARTKFELFLAGDRYGLYENYFRLKHKLGHDVWIWSRGKNLLDENGNLTDFTLGTHIDITQLKAIELNLKKSNEELEQFAFVASHDLQEPLRMVTNFLTILEKKYGNALDDKAKQYIFFAVDGAKRMRQIILDLLEYSRVGRFVKPKIDVDVNAIIEELKFLHMDLIANRKAIFKCEHLPIVFADYSPLYQVFNNLISNALKYHVKGSQAKINIGVRDLKEVYEFYISDNGEGIAPEYHEKIFNLFQRLHTKSEHEGNGMGLAITRKLVENWGGNIWLESKEGEGSTFYFTIPKFKKVEF